jgi:hypothetical protein
MARTAGKGGKVFASTTGSGVASPIVNITKWTLDRSTNKIPVTAFGDLNEVAVLGLPKLTGTITGFWDTATDPLYAAGISADGTNLYLYPDFTNTPSAYDYGPAWLDTAIDVDVNGAVQMTANFVARGSWGHKP